MQDHSGRPAGEDAEQIFRRYADTLFRFCFTVTGNQADVRRCRVRDHDSVYHARPGV